MVGSAAVLGAASGTVKQRAAGAQGLRAFQCTKWVIVAAFSGFVLCVTACGGNRPPPTVDNTLVRRVARCIAAPRPVSDAAQAAMLNVPAGQAVVGSSAQERALAVQLSGAGSAPLFQHEQPQRIETLAAFRFDRTPITNQAFAEFVSSCGKVPPDVETITPSVWTDLAQRLGLSFTYAQIQRFVWPGANPHAERLAHPVVLVTHDDANFYCAWRGARLPTELEWERAARGTNGQVFPWGNRFDHAQVNTRESGTLDTVEVGAFSLSTSPIGAYDMGGLVFEWTDSTFEGEPNARVLKSNSWNRRGGQSRGAARTWRTETLRDVEVGFRCALSGNERATPAVAADSL